MCILSMTAQRVLFLAQTSYQISSSIFVNLRQNKIAPPEIEDAKVELARLASVNEVQLPASIDLPQ